MTASDLKRSFSWLNNTEELVSHGWISSFTFDFVCDICCLCSTCGEKFLWQNSLRRHLWKHGVGREPKHQCTVCYKLFFMPYQLRTHMQTHSGDKPHMCHECGRRFSSRSSMRCHQMYSHAAQPRPCPECGKQFKSARVVRQHLRVAHQGATHTCPHCAMEFRQQAWLNWHVMSHVSDQSFMCNECQPVCNSASHVTGA